MASNYLASNPMVVIGIAQTLALSGIFLRLGSITTDMTHMKDSMARLRARISELEGHH